MDRLRDECDDGYFACHRLPDKSTHEPGLLYKLALIGFAVWVMQKLNSQVFEDSSLSEADMMARGAALAKYSLFLWFGAITAGRLLAYTYKYLTFPS